MSKWKRLVMERDGYACIHCKSQKNLHTHHILPKSQGGKDEVENGVTVCRKCHYSVYKKNTTTQAASKGNREGPKESPSACTVYMIARICLRQLELQGWTQ